MSSPYRDTSPIEDETLEYAVEHPHTSHSLTRPPDQTGHNGIDTSKEETPSESFVAVEGPPIPGEGQLEDMKEDSKQASTDHGASHISGSDGAVDPETPPDHASSIKEAVNIGKTGHESVPQSPSSLFAAVGPSDTEISRGTSSEAKHNNRPHETPVLGSIPSLERTAVTESGGEDSQSEIQSIMEQFDEGAHDPEEHLEGMLETGPRISLLPDSFSYPPRHSSLDYNQDTLAASNLDGQIQESAKPAAGQDMSGPGGKKGGYSLLSKGASESGPDLPRTLSTDKAEVITSPKTAMSSTSLHKSLPPAPDPEPDLPFDFHRFLAQLRHRTADPVAKFLRSFLTEFGKKQWMVHEQVKIISDFLSFITNKMAQCEIWRGVSDAEFDNAKEGMEKLVMNRLYSQTFSPAIPATNPIFMSRGQKKNAEKPLVAGRRGQHQEDIERDEILAQKVRIYGWVREEHLDIAPVGESGKQFLALAQQELLKIKNYRAPRDKVICVLNCCKVIFGLLRNSKKGDTSADAFVPLLIYVVLQASPDHLVSNIQYIMRFRNQEKLGGEAGYYLSSLMGAIQFIENLDRTALTVSDEDFERHVEAAVSAIAERHKDHPEVYENVHFPDSSGNSMTNEKTRPSLETEHDYGRKSTDVTEETEGAEDNLAASGLFRNIKRPLSSIGRIFSEESTSPQSAGSSRGPQTSLGPPETPRRLSPGIFQPPRNSSDGANPESDPEVMRRPRLSAEEAAARQASAEAAEAYRIQRAEHKDVVETLISMFPDLDKDVIDDVVREKQGRVGLAVDACLALST